jgi:hypothetical protein
MKKTFYFLTISLLVFGIASVSYAYVSSSTSYRVQYDSINAGGNDSGSTGYAGQDTLGEVGSGDSTSAAYKTKAGYQELVPSYLSITAYPGNLAFSDISGYSGGSDDTSGTWTIKTDDPRGYSVKIKSLASPALTSGASSFPNYIDGNPTPSFNWSVASSTSAFGFTPEGSTIIQKFKDNGSTTCNTGSSDTPDACWYYFLTTDQEIANSNTYTTPAGDDVTVKLRYEAGATSNQTSGDYSASIVITVLPN